MDIHRPKPWHGLRELAKEIGIITIGVLIALGAEQTVEAIHNRHIIHEAEAAMRSELTDDDLPQAYVRVAIQPCLSAKLKELRSAVDEKIPPLRFARLAQNYGPPARTWDVDAWKATQSSVAGSRMSSRKLLSWSAAYTLLPALSHNALEESKNVERLHRTRFRNIDWGLALR